MKLRDCFLAFPNIATSDLLLPHSFIPSHVKPSLIRVVQLIISLNSWFVTNNCYKNNCRVTLSPFFSLSPLQLLNPIKHKRLTFPFNSAINSFLSSLSTVCNSNLSPSHSFDSSINHWFIFPYIFPLSLNLFAVPFFLG